MYDNQENRVSALRIRTHTLYQKPMPQQVPETQWMAESGKEQFGSSMMKNLAVTAVLILCVVTLRTGAFPAAEPATDVLLAAATDQSLLNDDLGRLSFVSALFPEAVLVFGEGINTDLDLPVSSGVVVHAWSEKEPYMIWRSATEEVRASAAGEVMGVYHGNGEERLVQVMGHDGLCCIYGNLESVYVRPGDAVSVGERIGTLMSGEDLVFEVRREGMSIDPALYLPQ